MTLIFLPSVPQPQDSKAVVLSHPKHQEFSKSRPSKRQNPQESDLELLLFRPMYFKCPRSRQDPALGIPDQMAVGNFASSTILGQAGWWQSSEMELAECMIHSTMQ